MASVVAAAAVLALVLAPAASAASSAVGVAVVPAPVAPPPAERPGGTGQDDAGQDDAGAATGQDGTPEPAAPTPDVPAAGDAPDGVAIELLSVQDVVLAPGGDLAVRVRVTNGGDAPAGDLTAELRLREDVLSARSDVAAWAQAPASDAAGEVVLGVALQAPLAPRTARELDMSVPASGLDLADDGDAWGPRGVAVDVVDDRGSRLGADRGFVVWYPEGPRGGPDAGSGRAPVDDPARVSVVVPIVPGRPDIGTGLVPAEEMTALTDPDAAAPGAGPPTDGRLARTLVVASRPGVTWALDPLLLDSSAPAPGTAPAEEDQGAAEGPGQPPAADQEDGVAGDALAPGGVPPSATTLRWREQLLAGAAGREVLALPWADTDVLSVAASGGEGLWQQAQQLGRRALGAAGLTVDGSDGTGGSVRTDVAWPAGGEVDQDTAQLLAEGGTAGVLVRAGLSQPPPLSGDGDGDATTRLPLEVPALPLAPADEDEPTGVVVDAALSRALADVAEGGAGAASAVALLHADTAALALEGAQDSSTDPSSDAGRAVVTAPRDWDVDPGEGVAALAALTSTPWVEPAPVADLLAGTTAAEDEGLVAAPTGGGAAQTTGPLDPGRLQEVAAAVDAVGALGPALTDLRPLDVLRRRAAAAASLSWRGAPAPWQEQVDALVDDARSVAGGVQVLQGAAVNVVGEETSVPVTIDNALDQEVRVAVRATSESPRLRVDDEPVTAVAARSRTQVQVPVVALANGSTTLQLRLLAPDGTVLTDPVEVPVRVNVEWEAWGTAGVLGLGAVVLLVGIVRTVRRVRRRPSGTGPRTPTRGVVR